MSILDKQGGKRVLQHKKITLKIANSLWTAHRNPSCLLDTAQTSRGILIFWLNEVRPRFCPGFVAVPSRKMYQTRGHILGKLTETATGGVTTRNVCTAAFSGSSRIAFALLRCCTNQTLHMEVAIRCKIGKRESKDKQAEVQVPSLRLQEFKAPCQTLSKLTTAMENKKVSKTTAASNKPKFSIRASVELLIFIFYLAEKFF